MHLTFTCAVCESDYPFQPDDSVPDVQVKFRRAERRCRQCGYTHESLDVPDECPNDNCARPSEGFAPADRVVTNTVRLPVCNDCQKDVDAESLL